MTIEDFHTSLSYGIIHVEGANAENFLQGQLTADIREVSDLRIALSAICNPQGRVVATMYVCKFQNELFLIAPESMVALIINHLMKYAMFSKVVLRDVSSEFKIIGIVGAIKNLAALGVELPSKLYDATSIDDQKLIMRISHSLRFVLLNPAASSEQMFIPNRENDWQIENIREGIAMIYPKTSLQFTPDMLNYPKLGAVSYKKGCYVGQEIIARTHFIGKSKRGLYCGASKLNPEIGDLLYAQDREVGVIVETCVAQEHNYLFLAVVQDQAAGEKLTGREEKLGEITELVRT